MFGLPNE